MYSFYINLESEFRMNSWTNGAQHSPITCALNNGGFVIVYRFYTDYKGSIFDSNGIKINSGFDVQSTNTNY